MYPSTSHLILAAELAALDRDTVLFALCEAANQLNAQPTRPFTSRGCMDELFMMELDDHHFRSTWNIGYLGDGLIGPAVAGYEWLSTSFGWSVQLHRLQSPLPRNGPNVGLAGEHPRTASWTNQVEKYPWQDSTDSKLMKRVRLINVGNGREGHVQVGSIAPFDAVSYSTVICVAALQALKKSKKKATQRLAMPASH
ncbi:hypothetical protein OPT61_g9907 [Boeremia exigua]|uniref:Uncharacterized protein n=1 Tax=Boeremia exigua TaxID=749465 RepID=A0ACC2HS41_9PLEO|nr:hypothetical protein OPT61_g9907 [Boeremia exigua]